MTIMKKTCLILAIFCCVFLSIQQKAVAQLNVLKLNPPSLLALNLNGQYERALDDHKSVQVGLFASGFSPKFGDKQFIFRGVGITPEFRYYLARGRNKAPHGLFGGPYMRYTNLSVTVENEAQEIISSVELNTIGAGLVLGYQHIISKVFSIEALIGPGLAKKSLNVRYGDFDENDIPGLFRNLIPGFSPILLRASLTIGFAF